jgi:glyoxylate/hydroxypyruvate reductase
VKSMGNGKRVKVLIGSPFEPEMVERVRAVDPRLDVIYRPDLLGKPRFPADHIAPMERTQSQEEEWDRLVADAEIMLDAYRPSSSNLPLRAPRLRWIQFSSSGVGGFVEHMCLANSPILVTNVAGLHGAPLAEFVLLSMLYFAKDLPSVLADQRQHRWQRFAAHPLRGKTLGVLGLGGVGREVARVAKAVGMRVVGTKRTKAGASPDQYNVDAIYPNSDLHRLLAESDYLVLSVPLTPETDGMVGEAELAATKPGAVLINISRGAVVDEPAMIRALQSGHLGGAALDVFAVEPLPDDSPLWDMPNVLVTSHSMSTVVGENEQVIDIFIDNLRRYLVGQPLRNLFDRERGY